MSLRKVLLGRGYSKEEVDDLIETWISEIEDGEDPEELLRQEGLEPDYVFDLLNEF